MIGFSSCLGDADLWWSPPASNAAVPSAARKKCYGLLTLPVAETETETDKYGLYSNVWNNTHHTETETVAETVTDAIGSCTQFLGLGLGSVSVSKPLLCLAVRWTDTITVITPRVTL